MALHIFDIRHRAELPKRREKLEQGGEWQKHALKRMAHVQIHAHKRTNNQTHTYTQHTTHTPTRTSTFTHTHRQTYTHSHTKHLEQFALGKGAKEREPDVIPDRRVMRESGGSSIAWLVTGYMSQVS
jgi:hypothetical protein